MQTPDLPASLAALVSSRTESIRAVSRSDAAAASLRGDASRADAAAFGLSPQGQMVVLARVELKRGAQVVLDIGGRLVTTESSLPLQVGEQVQVRLRGLETGKLAITLLPEASSHASTSTSASLDTLLAEMGLAGTSEERALASWMLQRGIGLEEKTFKALLSTLQPGGLTPARQEAILYARSYGLPLTQTTLAAVETYLAARPQWGDHMRAAVQALRVLADTLSQAEVALLSPRPPTDPSALTPSATPTPPTSSVPPQAPAGGGAPTAPEVTAPAPEAQVPQPASPSALPSTTAARAQEATPHPALPPTTEALLQALQGDSQSPLERAEMLRSLVSRSLPLAQAFTVGPESGAGSIREALRGLMTSTESTLLQVAARALGREELLLDSSLSPSFPPHSTPTGQALPLGAPIQAAASMGSLPVPAAKDAAAHEAHGPIGDAPPHHGIEGEPEASHALEGGLAHGPLAPDTLHSFQRLRDSLHRLVDHLPSEAATTREMKSLLSDVRTASHLLDAQRMLNASGELRDDEGRAFLAIPFAMATPPPQGSTEVRIYPPPRRKPGAPMRLEDLKVSFHVDTEHLGKMRIDLAWQAARLNFHFLVDRPEVLDFVQDHATTLEQRLQGHGVEVGRFDWGLAPSSPTSEAPTERIERIERLGELDMRA